MRHAGATNGFVEDHGHRRVDQMTREHVDVVIGKMSNKPGAGIILLKRIRTLIRYPMALGWTDRDRSRSGGLKGHASALPSRCYFIRGNAVQIFIG
jgi:hypothetical protein